MHLLFANQWLSPSLIESLGWTLVHSLWQGIVIAIIALVVLWLTKRSSPFLRYNLLLILFTLFIATVSITFSMQYRAIETEKLKEINSLELSKNTLFSPTNTFLIIKQTKDYLTAFEDGFSRHANLIVSIWFFIFCIHCLRLFSSIGYIYRIRNYKTYVPLSNWLKRCTELKNELGIQKQVSLLESAIVKVPVVIGFFKPLILLPVGLLANLPYHQVESILLHELAHIKRRDYLVNLLQSFVETIFFFNPAILWISSLIKEEREACCDEMAVMHLDSKSHYIEALVSFQEYATNSSGYAMAFPGRKDHLLQRVKRIINNENKKLNSMQKTILFCGIIAITAVAVLSNKGAKAQSETLPIESKTLLAKADTIPKKNMQNATKASSEKKGTRTRVTTDNDGNEKIVVLESNNGSGRDIKAKLKDNTLFQLSINDKEIPDSELMNYEQEIKSIIDEQHTQAAIATQKASIANQQLSEKVSQLKIEKQQKLVEVSQEDERKKFESQKTQQLKDGEVQITYKNSGEEDSHQQVENILNVLKGASIIKGKEGTTFKLTHSELVVNGLKQSADLHQQLKQKYIYNPGDFYTFTSSG
nr:M56 family metallopeptidase [Chitinophagaceae bacterium]